MEKTPKFALSIFSQYSFLSGNAMMDRMHTQTRLSELLGMKESLGEEIASLRRTTRELDAHIEWKTKEYDKIQKYVFHITLPIAFC
jgi:hypothetical protein